MQILCLALDFWKYVLCLTRYPDVDYADLIPAVDRLISTYADQGCGVVSFG